MRSENEGRNDNRMKNRHGKHNRKHDNTNKKGSLVKTHEKERFKKKERTGALQRRRRRLENF